MESMDSRDAVLELILELLAEDEFRAGPSRRARAAGLPARLAARRSTRSSTWLDGAGASARTPLTIRLVKGAYWDHELVQAAQHGWSPPVFERKADTDANFELLTRRLLDARPLVRVAIASHNLRSVAHAIAYNRLDRRRRRTTSSCRSCAGSATRCRPRSPPRACACAPTARSATSSPGMAYLVRRLLENTSNESFLYEQARGVPLEELLARARRHDRAPRRARREARSTERADPRAAPARRCGRSCTARWRPSTPSR